MLDQRARQGWLQTRTTLDTNMASHIPDGMSYADACVLPLGVGTAACGLFQIDQVALDHPCVGAERNGKTLLVWGGASSAGCCAVQLAAVASHDVVTNGSPKNAAVLKHLGAVEVIDDHDENLAASAVDVFAGRLFAGAIFAVGDTKPCYSAVSRLTGDRAIASTAPVPRDKPTNVAATQFFGIALKNNEVGKAIYEDDLPAALADGSFVPAPSAKVVGHGLAAP